MNRIPNAHALGDKTTQPQLRTAWLSTSFAVLAGLTILAADRWLDHPLAGFREEYGGGGSCKLRGHEAFHLLLLAGLLAFPAAVAGATTFAASLLRSPHPTDRRWFGLALGVCGLGLLLRLGFVEPALGICPLYASDRPRFLARTDLDPDGHGTFPCLDSRA